MKLKRIVPALLAVLLLAAVLPISVLAAAPVATPGNFSTDEDTAHTVTLSGEDDDADALIFAIGGGPSHGDLSGIGTPDCTGSPSTCTADVQYTPDANYHGSDSFTFTVDDGSTTDTATVDITVDSINDKPNAVNDPTNPVVEDTTTTLHPRTNDTDPENDALEITDKTNGAKGSVTIINGGADVSYDPNQNATGADSFSYTIDDGNGGTDTATVSVQISPVNDNPVAVNDLLNPIDEDTTTVLDVLGNDTDPDQGDVQTVSAVTQGGKGLVTITNASTRVTYNPNANAIGNDTFTYTVSDGHGGTDIGTVQVQIAAENDDPIANPDPTNPVTEDVTTTLHPRANDTDPDGDSLTIIAKTNGLKGSVTIVNGGNDVSYDPTLNATGTDTFTYTISDGHGGTDVGTVTVQITPQDDAPIAVNDTRTIDEDPGPVTIAVLVNDTDVDGPSLTVTGKTNPSHGTLTLVSGILTYTPDPDFNGIDTFDYTVSDGTLSDVGTVTITVTPVNDPPVAGDDVVTMAEDPGATTIPVLGNDSDVDDALAVISKTDPMHGVLTLVGGVLTYTPNQDYNGPDTFSYTIGDGEFTDIGAVTITVTPENDAPIAVDDAVTITRDTAANPIAVQANDTDPDGDTLTITAKTDPSKGSVVITGGGTGLTYDPFTGLLGADSFTYTIGDGQGGFDTATVDINITGANRHPNAVNDVGFSVPEGAGPRILDVLANDDDPDGDTFTVIARSNGAHGITRITAGGAAVTYDPNSLFHGTDTFTYTIRDAGGLTKTATVVVTVVRDTAAPVVVAPVQRFLGQTVGTTTIKARIAWSATDPGSGVKSYQLQQSVNGHTYTTLKLPSLTRNYLDVVLTNGASYHYRVRATDKEGNVSAWRYTQTFRPAVFQETTSLVSYVGIWSTYKTTGALGGGVKLTPTLGKTATFHYTMSDFGLVVTRTATSGSAEVYVDGVLAGTINLRATKTIYRQLIFLRHLSTLAVHTIEIRPTGTGRIDIDAFATLH